MDQPGEEDQAVELPRGEYLDVYQMSLDEWLAIIFNPPKDRIFINNHFPTERHRLEYLAGIENRTDEEVRRLLMKFLIHSGTNLSDEFSLECLKNYQKNNPTLFKKHIELQFYKRLILHYCGSREVPPWEGITWVLDLLPHFPEKATQALFAYFLAHCLHMPDAFIHRLQDAQEIIQAKYIGWPKSHDECLVHLCSQGPRSFECLVERLYWYRDYETLLTPPRKDGGRDIVARKHTPGQREKLLVECKLYTAPVGVEFARALLGNVFDEKANKGVLITSNRFTRGSKEFAQDNPLELIDGVSLMSLFNQHLGARWPLQTDRLVAEANGLLPAKKRDPDLR